MKPTFRMLDEDMVAASHSSVYRVLKQPGSTDSGIGNLPGIYKLSCSSVKAKTLLKETESFSRLSY